MTERPIRVAFAGTFAATLEGPVRARLALPCEVLVADEASVASKLADVDVLVTLAFTREMAAAAPRLKLVQVPGAGLDRIDRAALPAGTWLANAYGHEVGIAEYVIGAMLAWTRGFATVDSALRRGEWQSQWAVGTPAPPPWPELAGKTLGIVGYGRIGQALARRARAFDMTVCAIRRDPARSPGEDLALLAGPDRLDDVLRRSDYLALTLSLDATSLGLIGERELRLMKRTAFLVNVARAVVVDEAALHRALAEGWIAGAALDVYEDEPLGRDSALRRLDPERVILTPHAIGNNVASHHTGTKMAIESVLQALRGEVPRYLKNPRAVEQWRERFFAAAAAR